jgi:hypothetical protein
MQRIYRFQFVPLGFFGRLIVKLLHLSDVVVLKSWREGVLLQNTNETGMIQLKSTSDFQTHELKLTIRTNRSANGTWFV